MNSIKKKNLSEENLCFSMNKLKIEKKEELRLKNLKRYKEDSEYRKNIQEKNLIYARKKYNTDEYRTYMRNYMKEKVNNTEEHKKYMREYMREYMKSYKVKN
jgi:hypothetical protein